MPEKDVNIVAWPDEPAKLEHRFRMDKPCQVSISFEKAPANVVIDTSPENPLYVDMAMDVSAREPIPVCIKLCEPICARSDYAIEIEVFDRPVAAITIEGETRLFNCRKPEAQKPVCMDFSDMKMKLVFTEPFVHDQLTFSPLGVELRTADLGEPQNQVKLVFPREGLRIDFPMPVKEVRLTVNNYANPELHFLAYTGTHLISEFTENISNEVKQVVIQHTDITAVEIKGGDNEASVVEICYL